MWLYVKFSLLLMLTMIAMFIIAFASLIAAVNFHWLFIFGLVFEALPIALFPWFINSRE